MPRRSDLHTILILGSGPIVIGQACEFDYAGAQAVKALKTQGYRVVLVNSNPASIMTDPELADATYIEPLTVASLEQIIVRERPDALLPTVGGQTGLNLAVSLAEAGILDKYGVELIGARLETVKVAEDRQLFAQTMHLVGLPVAFGGFARSVPEGEALLEEVGFPAILRPSFTLGGEGSGIAYNIEEFRDLLSIGLSLSPVHQVLVERSVIGWKEFELEVMRDKADNAVIVCSIENIDPMGVHTGDSITVAPAMTLTDREYQRMRDWGLQVIRAVGVETGGSNVQFAIHPQTGEMLVVEMNPRVSRSSALASKATGFPIAKIAALLAVGLTLDEIPNDITKETPASFEPTLDYVVIKIPRWDFAKFPRSPSTLGTSMKSVGEVMAIGRTFKEAFQKGLRSLEIGVAGFEDGGGKIVIDDDNLVGHLVTPSWDRIFYIREAFQQGMSVAEVAEHTHIDPWFLGQLADIVAMEWELRRTPLAQTATEDLLRAKKWGFSDLQLSRILGCSAADVHTRRLADGLHPVYSRVDTCSAEFAASTPYLYSTWGSTSCEAEPTHRQKVLILGGGPIRIGQGIEFDCCCCHAAFALKDMGIESILMNCNPETVSTDYDTADRLYFEPLTLEDVQNLVDREKPDGLIVQFGGQTPLKLALALQAAGIPLLGTSPDAIDLAEDRERFGVLLRQLGIPQPQGGIARSESDAVNIAAELGYPVLVRPSYVLGGRAMVLAHHETELRRYIQQAVAVSDAHPVLIDHFLEKAIEVDVDVVCDGTETVVCGILQHVEHAGVHSGDSSAVLPPYSLTPGQLQTLREYSRQLAAALQVRGLMNVQYAIKEGVVYVLEVNPRASRTIPFISKATGIRWADVATRVIVGKSLAELGIREVELDHYYVKMVVLPWGRFPMEDTLLGPEMKSTGEVMGWDTNLGAALAKAQAGTGRPTPTSGTALLSVHDRDKHLLMPIARDLHEMGFQLMATTGTATALKAEGLPVERVYKVGEGRLDVVDHIKNGDIQLMINTPRMGRATTQPELALRQAATRYKVTTVTTMEGARALVDGIAAARRGVLHVSPIQSSTSRALT